MLKKYVILCAFMALIAITLLCISHLPELDVDKIQHPALSTRIYDRNNTEACVLSGTVNRLYVKLDELPDYVPLSFIAAEDTRYYEHNGIDVRRILGAALANIRSFSFAQGASTITQQVIKLTHLSSEKTLSRKLNEAILAIKLEKEMSKEEILEAYINTVYFGGGAYGIEAAAQRYFSKSASSLTLAESALLAGIIKSPSSYAPHINSEASQKRRDYILDSMTHVGYISKDTAENAKSMSVELLETPSGIYKYAWYIDAAAAEACEILNIDTEELLGGGYQIYTGLAPAYQNSAENILENDSFYPDNLAQGAFIAIDTHTGEICAMVGGRAYAVRSGLNRALSARRQPGSLIKPVSTYAAAIEEYGYMPYSVLYDAERTYGDGYTPGNYNGSFNGPVTMRDALSRSLNAATVDLADTIGIDAAIEYAGVFGINPEPSDSNLAFALGSMSSGTTPAEMCSAYAALANDGMHNTPHIIRSIRDRNGLLIFQYDEKPTRSVSPETAYILTDMLKTAVQTGTAKALNKLQIPIAAKTGTSGLENHDTSDAWAAAYTPEIAVTVWIGRDNNADGGMDRAVTGGGYAAPIIAEFFRSISGTIEQTDFRMPQTLTRRLIDRYMLEGELKTLLATESTPKEYVVSELFSADHKLEYSVIWQTPAAVCDLSVISKNGEIPVIQFTAAEPHVEYIVIRECDGMSELAGTLHADSPGLVYFEDTEADISKVNKYAVLPRHKLLSECGSLLYGPLSMPVKSQPGGLLNEISSLFDDDVNMTVSPEVISKPLF